MEKEKKVAKKPANKEEVQQPKKVKVETTKTAPVKAKKVQAVEPAVAEPVTPVVEAKVTEVEQPKKSKTTLNQELNLIIGLFSLITIVSFCFAFQGGEAEVLGWELFLKSGGYSGVFKGLMILYVVSIFVDCALAVRVDTENEIFNIIEKVLYMLTVIINFVVLAVLLSLISKIGIGLIIFMIVSIISAIVKFARIYSRNK